MESINFHEFKEISGEIRNYFYSKISEVHFVSSLRNLSKRVTKRTQKKKKKEDKPSNYESTRRNIVQREDNTIGIIEIDRGGGKGSRLYPLSSRLISRI